MVVIKVEDKKRFVNGENGGSMNLSQLYYFKKLAEREHYTKAAQELYITQPSLSKSIAALEDELNVTFFEKHGRNVMLTKIGQEFYQHVRGALAELEKGLDIIREYNNDLEGIVNIGTTTMMQREYLPKVLHDFNVNCSPRVTFNIFQGFSNNIVKGLRSREYDVGFCHLLENDPEICCVPILYMELVAAVNNRHPLSKKKSVTLDELADEFVITYHLRHLVGEKVHELIRKNGITTVCNYDDEVILGGIVEIQNCVAILLRTPATQQFKDLVFLPIEQVPKDFYVVYMAFMSSVMRSRAVESFIDYVAAHHAFPIR